MAAVTDIFGLWDTTTEFAKAISAKPDTVRKWKKFGRIPQDAWQSVIIAAALKGRELSVDDILAANTPMKQRGRPAHKPKSRRKRDTAALSVS